MAVEADGSVEVCVVIGSGVLDRNIQFTLSTMEGSASPGDDYTSQEFPLSFTPVPSEACVTVIVADDGVVEPMEEFSILLQSNDRSVDVELVTLSVPIVDSSSVELAFMQDAYSIAESETTDVCVQLEGQIDRTVTASVQVDNNGTYVCT